MLVLLLPSTIIKFKTKKRQRGGMRVKRASTRQKMRTGQLVRVSYLRLVCLLVMEEHTDLLALHVMSDKQPRYTVPIFFLMLATLTAK